MQEIAEHKGIPSYWVDSAARIDMSTNTVLHKLAYGELKETKNWLPKGPLRIGVTSGVFVGWISATHVPICSHA